MSFADDFEFARDSINAYGAPVTLRKPGSDAYDPATGNLAQGFTDYATTALIESYSEFHVAKGLVKAGDRRIILSAANLTVTPVQGDFILFEGQTFTVINVKSDYAGDRPIIHTLQIRN